MEPTVLAGAIEFSPAEIAAILAVLAALFLAVTSPGWLAMGYVLGRRSSGSRSRWPARVGGALLGIALSAAVSAGVGAVLDGFDYAALVAVLAAWCACWSVALLLRRGAAAPGAPPAQEGWGR